MRNLHSENATLTKGASVTTYRLPAEQGQVDAQIWLGFLYYVGLGIHKELKLIERPGVVAGVVSSVTTQRDNSRARAPLKRVDLNVRTRFQGEGSRDFSACR